MADQPSGKTRGHPKSTAKKSAHGTLVTPKVLAKADDIVAKTGIEKKAAIRVALGQTTVTEVLKEMMARDRVEKLTKQHGISRDRAFAVVKNKLPLKEAILLQEMKECPQWQPEKSILIELHESGAVRVFRTYGAADFTATVEKLTKFDCWLKTGDDAPKEYQKHDLLLVADPDGVEELNRLQKVDDEVKAKGLGPSVSYRDRYRSRKRVLYRHHRDELKTRVTLRDGTVLVGRVGWFGKWEFSLQLSSTCRVVVFRHAMYDLKDITPKEDESSKAREEVKKTGSNKSRPQPSSPKTSSPESPAPSPRSEQKETKKKNKKKKKKKKKKKRH